MTQLAIERSTPSKSGKSMIISAGGKTYYSKPEQNIPVGATIEAEISTSDYQGKEMLWINKYRIISQGTTVQRETPAVSQLTQPPWWMPFVSNTVAHAIQAGRIEGPAQIEAWASAAKTAAITLLKDEQEF